MPRLTGNSLMTSVWFSNTLLTFRLEIEVPSSSGEVFTFTRTRRSEGLHPALSTMASTARTANRVGRGLIASTPWVNGERRLGRFFPSARSLNAIFLDFVEERAVADVQQLRGARAVAARARQSAANQRLL